MKKLIAVTAVILMGCTVLSAAASGGKRINKTTKTSYSSESLPNITEQDYVIKLVNGRIIVYLDDMKTVYLMSEKDVSSLPQGDKLLLEKGILVHGEENLKKSLEDYCS